MDGQIDANFVKKETCSLLTVKLRLGWVGGAAVLLDAATLEDADGALSVDGAKCA